MSSSSKATFETLKNIIEKQRALLKEASQLFHDYAKHHSDKGPGHEDKPALQTDHLQYDADAQIRHHSNEHITFKALKGVECILKGLTKPTPFQQQILEIIDTAEHSGASFMSILKAVQAAFKKEISQHPSFPVCDVINSWLLQVIDQALAQAAETNTQPEKEIEMKENLNKMNSIGSFIELTTKALDSLVDKPGLNSEDLQEFQRLVNEAIAFCNRKSIMPKVTKVTVNKFVRDGSVAVLYSKVRHAGFSTALANEFEEAGSSAEAACQNPLIVWHILTGDHAKATEAIRELYAIHYNAAALTVGWVRLGNAFRFDEIDGLECVESINKLAFFTA